MPKNMQIYFQSVAIGFCLSAVVFALLVGFNAVGWGHLTVQTANGAVMLFLAYGIIIAGVQFGLAVMRLAEDCTAKGGLAAPLYLRPSMVKVAAKPREKPKR